MYRTAITVIILMSSSTIVLGSIWESPDWAVVGTLSASAGYNSNLTLANDGPGDFLLVVNPYLTLKRRGSDTDFEINGGVTETDFLRGSLPSETDLSLNMIYAYPSGDNVVPIYKLQASWQRSSEPNEFLGQRIENDQLVIFGENYFTLTGKLGIRGNAEFDSATYDSQQLNESYIGKASFGLAYDRTHNSEFSINFGGILGRSIPNDPQRKESNVRSTEYYVTARMQGEITAKLYGSVYAGFGEVEYTGGYANHENLPLGGADLTWSIDPRRTLVLAAYSGADYAPDGEAVYTTHAFVSFTNVVIEHWQYILRGGPTYSVLRRATDQ